MTQKQFTRALTLLGLTQTEFARAIHVNERTVRNWVIGGRSPVPDHIAMLVNLLQDSGKSIEDLRC